MNCAGAQDLPEDPTHAWGYMRKTRCVFSWHAV
jgi:hypothetical protein